jgi:DNA repair protein RadA/Sms
MIRGKFNMATKQKAPSTQYVCSECGFTAPKWLGKCPDCGNFNTMQEEIVRPASTPKIENGRTMYEMKSRARPLSQIDYEKFDRVKSGIAEFEVTSKEAVLKYIG